MESHLHPRNETEHSFSRTTKEGKTLTYNLKVIQQPERARACGAGAKSSADRRPVDPPPVVELRILETDPNDGHKTDITFGYNANFFLYATLATARPMAHGRVQGQPPSCPALTGVPVAGIAYLDRPTQAGYFIFPDLSVRHEGRYRLSFNLYEQVKDAKDADKDSPLPVQDNNVPSTPSKPSAPRAHLHFRLEVKSVPFTVYSAKKFPGLAESTSLSRIVAEQGCRVRIRRDVRMRRRETKANKDFPDYEENHNPSYVRPDRYMTPESYSAPVERPRSTSNSTVDVPYSYPEPQRRPSIPDFGYHTPQPYPQQPVTPTGGYHSHLSFGSAQAQYHAPPLPAQHHPPPPPPPPAAPAPYSPHPGYSHVHSRQGSASSDYDPNVQKYPQPHYATPARHHVERNDYAKTHPSPMQPMQPMQLDPPRKYSAQPYDYRSSDPKAYQSAGSIPASSPRSRTPSTSYPPLAPAQSISSEIEAQHQHYQQQQQQQQSMNGAIPADPAPGKGLVYNTEQVRSKRSHTDVFGTRQLEKPLHDGLRPDTAPERDATPSNKATEVEADETPYDSTDTNMVYKRADGRQVMKLRALAQGV